MKTSASEAARRRYGYIGVRRSSCHLCSCTTIIRYLTSEHEFAEWQLLCTTAERSLRKTRRTRVVSIDDEVRTVCPIDSIDRSIDVYHIKVTKITVIMLRRFRDFPPSVDRRAGDNNVLPYQADSRSHAITGQWLLTMTFATLYRDLNRSDTNPTLLQPDMVFV